MCLMPSTDSASTMALTPADREPTVPASPAPFTPSGLVAVGTGLSSITSSLPRLVIGLVLHQHLTQALGDAAHDLILDQHWVDHGAHIVHHPIADQLRAARLGIDLDLADVATIGEIAAAGAIGGGLIEARFHAGRQLVQLERRLGHLVDTHGAVGAGDGEAA